MTPVFCCGFECGVTAAHWNLTVGGSFDTTIKRSGARSLKLTSGVSAVISNSIVFSSNIAVLKAYVYFNSLSASVSFNLFRFENAGIIRGAVSVDGTNSKIFSRCAGNQGATGVDITAQRWILIEMKLNISNNPWTCDVKVDGTDCAQSTNAVAANTYTGLFVINNNDPGTDTYVDDVVLSQTVGDYPIGAGYVNHFIPTSDGTHNVAGTGDFQRTLTGTDILNATTTAFQLVDDVPLESGASVDWINLLAPPNATDYVECVFGAASGIRTPLVAPRAVEVIAGIHQAGATAGNMEIRINDNGTTNAMYTATAVVGTTTVIYKRKCYAANIANGGAWTVVSGAGNFNNLRMRFGSPAAVDANPDQYLDCIMIEAEFKEILFNKPLFVIQAVNRAGTY